MEDSKIQWTDHTFNPWIGCAKVHTGCANCYAENLMADRYKRVVWGKEGTRVRTKTWKDPLRWNAAAKASGTRARVFCASLADIFEQRGELMPWRADLFKLIDRCQALDWLLLTKRPENVPGMWHTRPQFDDKGLQWGACEPTRLEFQRDNVWLGTSISDQATADEWVPRLLALRKFSPVLFVSLEPQIGEVILKPEWLAEGGLDWVIVGGESKQGKADPRPFLLKWATSIINQCKQADVPCFFKQWGTVAAKANGLRDSHGGDMGEWMESLRVREFPRRRASEAGFASLAASERRDVANVS